MDIDNRKIFAISSRNNRIIRKTFVEKQFLANQGILRTTQMHIDFLLKVLQDDVETEEDRNLFAEEIINLKLFCKGKRTEVEAQMSELAELNEQIASFREDQEDLSKYNNVISFEEWKIKKQISSEKEEQ